MVIFLAPIAEYKEILTYPDNFFEYKLLHLNSMDLKQILAVLERKKSRS